jgi:hypothetical protein
MRNGRSFLHNHSRNRIATSMPLAILRSDRFDRDGLAVAAQKCGFTLARNPTTAAYAAAERDQHQQDARSRAAPKP